MKVKIEINCQNGGQLKQNLFSIIDMLNKEVIRINTENMALIKKPTCFDSFNATGSMATRISDFTGDDLLYGIENTESGKNWEI